MKTREPNWGIVSVNEPSEVASIGSAIIYLLEGAVKAGAIDGATAQVILCGLVGAGIQSRFDEPDRAEAIRLAMNVIASAAR